MTSAYLKRLASFVPSVVIVEANEGHDRLDEARLTPLPGAVLFVDIAGFTALTETLAIRGPAGAEDLIILLNRALGRLIETVRAHGGDILKFAGDALIAIWRAVEGESLGDAARRAAACMLEIRATLSDFEVADGFRLRVKQALGVGDVWTERLGGVFDRWELLVAGEALRQIGLAADHARPGDALLSPRAHLLLEDAVGGEPAPDGCLRATALSDAPAPRNVRIEPAPNAAALMRAFIPAAVRSRLDHEDVEWLGELRRVSILFVNLPDFAVDTPLDRAQEAMRAIQLAIYRFEGSINKLGADDKGATMVAAFGLPPLAHADDPERATRAATAVRNALADLGFRSWIGVSTGVAFCGVVGNESRREYTVMGDVVNLAARLMQAAGGGKRGEPVEGGVLLCPATAAEAGRNLACEALPPIRVKGKTDPIAVSRPLPNAPAPAQARRKGLKLVGRRRERETVARMLEIVGAEGAPRRLALVGDVGAGKSRLVQEAVMLAAEHGVAPLLGVAEPLETTTPYRPWRAVFETLLAEGAPEEPEARRIAVLDRLPPDPDVLRDAPLLEAVLPLGWEQTPFTADLRGEARARRTRALLCKILAAAARRAPLLLALEDLHWFDSASTALVEDTLRLDAPIAHLATLRSGEVDPPPDWLRALEAAGLASVALDPLADAEAVELARLRLGVKRLPKAVEAFLSEQSDGNPAFVEELAVSMLESGALAIEGDAAVLTEDDPTRSWSPPRTLEGLMAARIDRLPAEEQMTLKVASVIGRVFERRMLSSVHPSERDAGRLDEQCAFLARHQMTPPVTAGSVIPGARAETTAWKFKTNLLKQVAYDRMLFAQRRELHRRVAEWLEADGRADDPNEAATLATHWRNAAEDRTPDSQAAVKAGHYYGRAARRAMHLYALQEAIGLWKEGVGLLRRVAPSEARDRAELALLLELGPALVTAGSFAAPEVEEAFDRARALCDAVGGYGDLFRALRGLWQVRTGQAQYAAARTLAERMRELAEAGDDDGHRMEAERALGFTAFWTGDFTGARAALLRAIAHHDACRHRDLARDYGQDPMVGARGLLAWTFAHLGESDAARGEAAEAERVAEALKHPFSLAYAHGVAMWTGFFLDDADAAAAAARRCEDLSLERGFPYLAAAARLVAAWARSDLDGVDRAAEDWARAGGGIGMPIFRLAQTRAHLAAGRRDAAATLLAQAAAAGQIDREPWLADHWRRLETALGASRRNGGAR